MARKKHAARLIDVYLEKGSPLRLPNIVDTWEVGLRKDGIRPPRAARETVSRTLQDHCRACAGWKGAYDLFSMPEGKGRGLWAINWDEAERYLEEHDGAGGVFVTAAPYQDRLKDILVGEKMEARARIDSLGRCEDAGLSDIETLREAATEQLVCEVDDLRKRYLFSYVEQLHKVISQLRNETRPGL